MTRLTGILPYVIVHLLAAVPLDDDGGSGPFALVQGIPVHPLVVHAAVVFVPLAALGLLLMAVWPKLGARFGWVVTLAAFIALGASWVAKESGEQLENLVGEPGYDHAEWGDRMPLFAGALFVACLVLWLVQRSWAKRDGGGKALLVVFGILGALVAAVNLYWIIQVGHSGAESVWKGEVSADAALSPGPATSASPSGKATVYPLF